MKRKSFNQNQIKYLIIIAMLIDHIAWAFVPMDSVLGQVMHFIGRLTGPTMAYFIAEGYQHTKNVKKYATRLGVFALLSWAPFCIFEFNSFPICIKTGNVSFHSGCLQLYIESWNISIGIFPWFGVIYTLFLSLLAIWLWDKGHCPKWCKVFGIIGLCILSVFGDWPIFDILYALFLFCYKDQPKKKWTIFCIITVFSFIFGGLSWTGLFQLGILIVPLLIQFFYNGERGNKHPIHKWFFYIFYPVHFLLLSLLKWIL